MTSSWAGRGSRGVTLLELIAVIVIFSLLLAFSIGYMRVADQDLGVTAAAHHVIALLRGAHQVSRGDASPAWVVLRTRENSVFMMAKETLGEWHFEDPPEEGAFGRRARITGGTLVPGRVGQALLLGGGQVDGGEVPVHDPAQGIAVECWLLWQPAGGRQVLCTVGRLLEIAVEGDGRVQARLGNLSVSSRDLRLPQGFPQPLWCSLQLLYGGGELRLYLNDRLTEAKAGPLAWTESASFVVGDRNSPFKGAVDELRLSLILPRDVYDLPGQARFVLAPPAVPNPQTGEYVIHFDPEGRLDPARHSQPVRFSLKSPAGERVVEVGLEGTVQR